MKIKCILPDDHELKACDHLSLPPGESAKPVIVILDAEKLKIRLFIGDDALQPKRMRIDRAEEYIAASNTVMLPTIVHRNGKAIFQNGRHRTLALNERRLTTIPCLTEASMKNALLAEYGAAEHEALASYDLAACSRYPIYGLA